MPRVLKWLRQRFCLFAFFDTQGADSGVDGAPEGLLSLIAELFVRAWRASALALVLNVAVAVASRTDSAMVAMGFIGRSHLVGKESGRL